jgi:transposase
MPRPHGAAEGQRQRIARLKQRARQLRAEGRSIREIADLLGVGRGTAHRYATSVPGSAPPPPPKDNQRATTNGAQSRVTLAAVAEKFREAAAERWPWLGRDDVETWALLAARHELAVAAEMSGGIMTVDGRIRDVSNKGVQWGARLQRLTAERDAEAERRAAAPGVVGASDGRGRDLVRLAALADGRCARTLIAALRGRPWGDVVSDPILVNFGRAALAEMEGRAAPEPESASERPDLRVVEGGQEPLLLPPAPGDEGAA